MEKKINNWIENCLGYTDKKYTTNSGNGKNIPLYKYDDEDHKMVALKNKDGKAKTHNLYLEIQEAKASTDYKKLIENTDFDLEKVNLILKNENPKNAWQQAQFDYTNLGNIETLKSMENKIVNTFGSIENFNEYCNKKFNQYKKTLELQQKIAKKNHEMALKKAEKEKEALEKWKSEQAKK